MVFGASDVTRFIFAAAKIMVSLRRAVATDLPLAGQIIWFESRIRNNKRSHPPMGWLLLELVT